LQGKKTYLFTTAFEHLPTTQKQAFLDAFVSTQLDDNQKITLIKDFYNKANVKQQIFDVINLYFEKSLLSLQQLVADKIKKQELEHFAQQLMGRKK
jgi:geranylgeranyl pyrophosphate synthase